MSKHFIRAFAVFGVISVFTFIGAAQDKVTQIVNNADGTYTVIEYPVGKEVMVNMSPSAAISGGKAMAHITRSADGTKIILNVSGVPADTRTYYAYAVDTSGVPTLLGPVTFENGIAKSEFMTPMNQFMIVLSPNEGITTVDAQTAAFRSDVPEGYAVVPRRRTADTKAVATAQPVTSAYDVPMLGIPAFGDDTTEVRMNFTGELRGLDGKAYIDSKGEKTTVKMRFGDMRKAPLNKRYVLWAASPEGKYTKLGQVISTGKQDEGEIRSETELRDFGLLVTVEDANTNRPTSRNYGTFSVPPRP